MKTLVTGEAGGAPLVLRAPLSFWGGLEAATGKVIDPWHPDAGCVLTGRVLMMDRGRGSSSGASVLAEAIRLGTAPAAILLRFPDEIITTGALVAATLYGRNCPVIWVTDADLWARCAAAGHVQVTATETTVDLRPQGRASLA